MKVKNLTTFPFGAKVTSRRQRRLEMTAIVRACYAIEPGKPLALGEVPTKTLAQGAMTADAYAEEDVERAGECLYPGDFADWKPKAEVMLRGTCHVPLGKAVSECPVRFSVGAWSKTLRIVGRRLWSDDTARAVMTNPTPFTTTPVDYAHAFGGPGHAANPVGLGAAGRELPNVEHAGAAIRARKDDPGPAGFGPINPAWAPRAGKVGKAYGTRWKRDRAPFYADDFDWSYFNAAPADQQLDAFLRGDEKLTFQNLHPTERVLEVSLPGLRIRTFVQDVAQRFREVPMSLDTLFVDLDAGKLYLTWRGLDPVQTDDLKDVLWALVASEPLAQSPLPEAHYRARLAAFEADPLGIKDRVPGDLLDKLEEMKARELARQEGRPLSQYDAPPPDPLTATMRAQMDSLPVALPGAKGIDAKVAQAVAAAIARATPQVDVAGQIAKAANDAALLLAKPAIPAVPLRPGGPPPASLAKGLRDALDKAQAVRAKLAASASKKPTDAIDEELAELDEQIEEIKNEPFFQAILSRPAFEEPGPRKDLRGQDYQDRDLRGRDLRGAVLKDANLAGANLAGAKLAAASLEGAILCGADLTEADLTGADLTLANLTSARAPRAVLADAKLDRAFLAQADLQGAVLRGARGQFVYLPEADLAGADCKELTLFRSFAKGANLARADFSGATLERCLMIETIATSLKLSRATLTRTSFAKSDLTGADATEARGERTVWLKAQLHDVDFTGAVLPHARFLEASALRVTFRRAVLTESRCYRTSFDGADFADAQLFGVEFTKCSLKRAHFTRACLYGAKFRQARGGGCDFTGANLTRALIA